VDVIPPEALLEDFPAPMQAIAQRLRDVVTQAIPEALERVRPGWRLIGDDLLTYIRSLRERLDFIARHAELWPLDESSGSECALFLPRTDPLPEDPSAGLDRHISNQGLTARVLGTIAPDRRSGGYGLSRHRDNARLDFTRIANEPDVHFAHARGFVAKTSATDPLRLRDLLRLALTKT